MKMNKRAFFAVAIAAVHLAAIGWLILRYERVVSRGVEVRFKCQAYDPYDPLRGRYLRTSVSENVYKLPASVTNYNHALNNRFFVRIEPATNGLWRVAEAAFAPAEEGVWFKPESSRLNYVLEYSERKDDEEYSDFEKRRQASGVLLNVQLPDKLFINEKLAPKAEKLLTAESDDAVAVYRVLGGEIVITDIEISGESILKRVRAESK